MLPGHASQGRPPGYHERMQLALLTLATFLAETPREHDIVIYGGTSAGISAAVQGARLHKSVLLIEPGKHLGGMTSGGLGATDIGNKKAIGGIAREFYRRIKKHYADDTSWKYESRTKFRCRGRRSPSCLPTTGPVTDTIRCCHCRRRSHGYAPAPGPSTPC